MYLPPEQKITSMIRAQWVDTLAVSLRRGQAASIVSRSIHPRAAAFSLVAEIEGVLSLSRNSQDGRVLRFGLENLRRHLEAMRPKRAS